MPVDGKLLKKVILFLAGSVILISGVTLILVWWRDVVTLFRGAVGVVLALAGLIVLVMIKD